MAFLSQVVASAAIKEIHDNCVCLRFAVSPGSFRDGNFLVFGYGINIYENALITLSWETGSDPVCM